jgi:large subunit ribosomal protein L1
LKKHSKKYVEASKKVEANKLYTADEAIKLVKETSTTNFDSTIELAVKLNIDAKKSDQSLRGSLVLPNGTGKSKKVLVFAQGENAKKAEAAGADYVGGKELVEKIKKENWFDFDVIVASPDMMPEVGKIGMILGPRGLMPNPKTGTVTPKVDEAVLNIKKGMIAYKNDSYGIIHTIIGKSSFEDKKLLENLNYAVATIAKAKPSSVKGVFVDSVSISSTMGPGIKLDKNNFDI